MKHKSNNNTPSPVGEGWGGVLILLLLLPVMAFGQTVVDPDYEYRVSSVFTIRSIERTKEYTKLNMRATFRPNWWFSFEANDVLVNREDASQRFLPVEIRPLQFGEHHFMGPEGVYDFEVVYPPIPDNVERVDMRSDRCMMIKGISLRNSRVDAFADQRERWMDAHPETPMKEMESVGRGAVTMQDFFRSGKVTLRGQIGHYNAGTGLSMIMMVTDIFSDGGVRQTSAIAADGTFEVTADVSGPANIELGFMFPGDGYGSYRCIYMEPGQTLDIFIDWEEDILVCDRSRGLLPCAPAVLRGPLAEVNRQIADAPTIGSWDVKTDRDLRANVESMMRHYHADMPAIKAYLKRGDLLPKAKQYIETETKMRHALMRLTLPQGLLYRTELEKSGNSGLTQEQISAYAKTLDAAYYDFLRDINLDDITLFMTLSGAHFLRNYGCGTETLFNCLVGEQTSGKERHLDSLLQRRARFFGYDHLPLADQFVLIAERVRGWKLMRQYADNGASIDDVGGGMLEKIEHDFQNETVERNLTHPTLKAFNDRMTAECKTMAEVVRSRPSARAEWMRTHPDAPQDEQLNAMLTDYDADTFFTIGRARVNGTIGRYDTTRPLKVYADMTGCGGGLAEKIEVAADGTFTIDEEITNPGVVTLMVYETDKFSLSNRMRLYLEPGCSLDMYLDFQDIINNDDYHLVLEPIVRGTFGTMNSLLRSINVNEFYTPDLMRPMDDIVAEIRARCEKDAEEIVDYYSTGKLTHLFSSERQMMLAARLFDLPMQKDWRDHYKVEVWNTDSMLSRQMKLVDADYYTFLRDLPADDICIVAAPSANRLLQALSFGGGNACSGLFDSVLAGERIDVANMDEDVLKHRLAFYGGDVLPLFEQVGVVRTVREHLQSDQPLPADSWMAKVSKYITNPGLRKMLESCLERKTL